MMKKIAAIMLSVMMVLGMCSVVGAEGMNGTSAPTGSITIDKAAPGETYNIYRILDLESYSGKTGNYAYKLRTYESTSTYNWNTFIKQDEIKGDSGYVTLDGEYVTWKDGVETTSDKAAEFAKKALDYAKNSTKIAADKTETAPLAATGATTSTVTFTDLPLGYYLVETSVGTVLALDTTNSTWTIEDKNKAPTVEKKVSKTEGGTYEPTNTASIGDTVYFKTTIHAKKGARNYVLHDKMSEGLSFVDSTIGIKLKKKVDGIEKDIEKTNYTTQVGKSCTTTTGETCTFEITFNQKFCDTLADDDEIIVTYSAKLNENAEIGTTKGNTNKTHLSYGDKSKTTEVTTTTYTFEIPVFKYTMKNTMKKALKDATFKLSTDPEGNTVIKLKQKDGTTNYFVDSAGEESVTTNDTGKFTIKGLAAGRYYLTETKQPAGYNKLSAPVTITIDANGNITVGESASSSVTEVEVENKTGSILPSTGGTGTTLFYIFGAILVVGSGVVLITKKRMK